MGGMGVVFEAHRIDESFKQRAALKIVRQGFLVDQGPRFLQERKLLASLAHPGIARFLDGGVADDGSPYLATELVEGQQITTYVNDNKLGVDARLSLFLQACDAVAYAHQNLVVHRDLKPAHILVDESSGQPVVKLLDFGIAKLLETDGPTITQTGASLMTPAYAAPEQILNKPVTTAADVYSLGVVLYETLTGHRPYELEGMSMSERERTVCVEDPVKPSDTPVSDATRRAIKGDLDQIVMKALQKDAGRRYGTAQSFADDIRRFMAGQPIEALPDVMSYRVRKFVARNRSVVAATISVLLTIVIIVAIFTVGLARERTRAQQSAEIAREQAARSQSISDFLERILRTPSDKWYVQSEKKGPDTPISDVLDEASRRLETDFASQPDLRADLHIIMGDTYMALGDVEKFEMHHLKALAIRESLYVAPHPLIAEALYYASIVDGQFGRTGDRVKKLAQAADMLRVKNEGNNFPFILQELSTILIRAGYSDYAKNLLSEAVQFTREHFVPGTDGYRYLDGLQIVLYQKIIDSEIRSGQFENAEKNLSTLDSMILASGEVLDGIDWLWETCARGSLQANRKNYLNALALLRTCNDFESEDALIPTVAIVDTLVMRTLSTAPGGSAEFAGLELFKVFEAIGDEKNRQLWAPEAERFTRSSDSLKAIIDASEILIDKSAQTDSIYSISRK